MVFFPCKNLYLILQNLGPSGAQGSSDVPHGTEVTAGDGRTGDHAAPTRADEVYFE